MFTANIPHELISSIAWTILHSFWQFAIIGIALFLILKFIDPAKSQLRYAVAFGALFLSVLSSLVTFNIYAVDVFGTAESSGAFAVENLYGYSYVSSTKASQFSFTNFFNQYMHWIVGIWFLGAMAFIIKSIGGLFYLRQLSQKMIPAEPKLLNGLRSLKSKLNIHRQVKIGTSRLIHSPIVIGYIKPIILFPVGIANQLNIDEVEAIIAHELAHIQRHDFLINLIQIFIENVFYYHPAIWFISNQIRTERENCCDDLAIQLTSNQINYAKTLVKLQEINISNVQLSLAFNNNRNHFKNRIMRLLENNTYPLQLKYKSISSLVFLSLFVLFATQMISNHRIKINNENAPEVYVIDECLQSPLEIKQYLDTFPERNSFHIKKKSNLKELELKMENGEITKLSIDGKDVPKEDYDKHENIIFELSPNEDVDIVTLFPPCDSSLGRLFYLDKDNEFPVNIDSLLTKVERSLENKEWYSFDEEEFNFDFDGINNHWLDSLSEELNALKLDEFILEKEINFDSIISHSLGHFPGNKEMEFKKFYKFPEADGDVEVYKFDFDTPFRLDEKDFDINIEFDEHFGDSFPRKKMKVSDILTTELLEDQLIQQNENNSVELTGKYLKINGDKQPKNIWQKYKQIYEQQTGIILTKKSKVAFEISAKHSNFPRQERLIIRTMDI